MSAIQLTNRFGAAVPRQPVSFTAPTGPYGGGNNFGFYDAVGYSSNRQIRPFFTADSRYTLNNWSRTRALALARWSYINVPYVRGGIDLMARLTVGTGFSPHTLSKDKGLAIAADAYYGEKTRNIGFSNGESMDELLLHDCRCADVDGDLGYVMTGDEFDQPKLQLIEGHRIKTGDVQDAACIDGVWVDNFARRVGYNVALPGGDDSYNTPTKRIAAQDFIYLAERNRPDELRSMTALIHALAPLQDLYEILGFAMQSAKKNSEVGIVVETYATDDWKGPQLTSYDSLPISSPPPTAPSYEQIFGSGGKSVLLRPGEKLNSFAHSHPSPTIEQWAEFIIRGIAVGYGVPFEVLWNPEAIGGANTRMITALLRARLIQRRASLILPKLTRVRFWILSRGIKRGELRYSPDLFKCDWNPNFSDITVDAGRESRERRLNVQAGLDTWTGYYSDNGAAYVDQAEVRRNDVAIQCNAARALVKEFPELSFGEALARISLITAGAMEVQNKVVDDTGAPPTPPPPPNGN